MFVLFCQFTFYLTTPIYCYYFMPCFVVLYGKFPFGRLICRSNGPYFSHDSHRAFCSFGNVCFVLSLCIILPVHILFDHADLLLLFYALTCCSLREFPIWQAYLSVQWTIF